MKKIALYDRYQLGKGKVLRLHLEKLNDIKEKIKSDGNELAGEFYDKCNEFVSHEKRPEFSRLYKMCDTGEIDELYVVSLSRASRDLRAIARMCEEMHEMGVKAFFVDERITGEALLNSKIVYCVNGPIKQELGM